ncbi:MAG: bifunctional precorrin-2 dehydrogenase/sirohydrochlorin ferrochelatase [Candidatus Nitrosopelagicus sp.]|nr:bifunctional precorrin-2 dehydrogenase/sirohydrochlorin ferrochelatase [Candidatus Nitrosopelagicus sp.]MBT6647397.1 bifunctional precorrin-2 dehydrogenase/sirohydrochlorin ferrochelatase [Nitrososphaerota archaeon]
MIIDLHLNGKTVVIIGAGNEALKRIKLLENEKCQIIVIGEKPHSEITKLSRTKKLMLKKTKLDSSLSLKKYSPFLVIASTTDNLLNQKIVQTARKMKILAYASDSPESSDISYLSLINIKKTIRVGISTGGASPIMAKKIKSKTEKYLKKNISNQDVQLIKIQKFARTESKKHISTQVERKKFLYTLMNDKRVKELLKDRKYKPIQTIIKKMVKNW